MRSDESADGEEDRHQGDADEDGEHLDGEELTVLQTALFQAIEECRLTVIDDLLNDYPIDLNLRNMVSRWFFGCNQKILILSLDFFSNDFDDSLSPSNSSMVSWPYKLLVVKVIRIWSICFVIAVQTLILWIA